MVWRVVGRSSASDDGTQHLELQLASFGVSWLDIHVFLRFRAMAILLVSQIHLPNTKVCLVHPEECWAFPAS